MDTAGLEIRYGHPFRGAALERLGRFLERQGFDYGGGVDFTVLVLDGDEIVATASLDGNLVRYVAVAWTHQGCGLAAAAVSEVVNRAAELGRNRLFLFAPPRARRVFSSLGFHEVARTGEAVLMENARGGLARYVRSLEKPKAGVAGCVVANCDPFTNGHLHLIETAARDCDIVHVFLTADSGERELPCETRRQLALAGTRHLENVVVQPAGQYFIPPHAFPDFFAEERLAENVRRDLDTALFADGIAGPLGIVRRYVGRKPSVAAALARGPSLRRALSGKGIEVIEVDRLEIGGAPVTGARVRSLCLRGKWDEVAKLVPPSTHAYLVSAAKN